MWQRFSESARRVVSNAEQEAQRLGDTSLSTEHLLLGLTCDPESVGCQTIRALGVQLSTVTAEVESSLTRGDAKASSHMTLTPHAKRVIDLAYEEAKSLSHRYVGA
jgi:ATP-dependent Clp protease ATP-binding subunit ClpC